MLIMTYLSRLWIFIHLYISMNSIKGTKIKYKFVLYVVKINKIVIKLINIHICI